VTSTEKASADKLFDGLDTQKRGYIESDVAVPFMLRSKLPEEILASIWSDSLRYLFGCNISQSRIGIWPTLTTTVVSLVTALRLLSI